MPQLDRQYTARELQKQHDPERDTYHRNALGLANDLQTALRPFRFQILNTATMCLLIKVHDIWEADEFARCLQTLKRRDVIRPKSRGQWKVY